MNDIANAAPSGSAYVSSAPRRHEIMGAPSLMGGAQAMPERLSK
jgi:hypothetical protein